VWERRAPHTLQAIRKQATHGLFPSIFRGERSELREKYGLGALRV
jgi:hypothetical protein